MHINKCMHAVHHTVRTQTQTQQRRAQDRKKNVCYFTAYLFSPHLPLFLPSFPSVSPPAVTRSNPQSNDHHSLTLIKGGQLTGGPGVTFIRRLVKVYFGLALNTRGADRTGAGYLDLG